MVIMKLLYLRAMAAPLKASPVICSSLVSSYFSRRNGQAGSGNDHIKVSVKMRETHLANLQSQPSHPFAGLEKGIQSILDIGMHLHPVLK